MSRLRHRWSVRFYRVLLLAYPRSFRSTHGAEAAHVFGDVFIAERAAGWSAIIALMARTVVQVLKDGLADRLSGSGVTPPSRRPNWGRGDAVRLTIKHAFRSLRRTPGFAVTAILIVAIGTGATTTIYSVVDGVLLRPLPFEDPEQLVTFTKDDASVPVPDFVDIQERSRSFGSLAAFWDQTVVLTDDGPPSEITNALATREFFRMLGGSPHLGRLFTADDFAPEASTVTVLSHRLWQQRWGGDPAIVGRSINVDGQPAIVVGVLDERFAAPESLVSDGIDIWFPADLEDPRLQHRRIYILSALARLRPGVSFETAQGEMDAIAVQLADEYPEDNRDDGEPLMFPLTSLRESIVGDVGTRLYILLGAVALMLLIACANVANLFLARGSDRQREMALRAALGAGRTRVIAHLLTESLILALAGGALGVVIASFGLSAFEVYNPGGVPRMGEVTINWRVLGFASLLATVTGVLFGLVPALQTAKTDIVNAIKEGTGQATASRSKGRLRNLLVTSEIGLALMLLIAAGLLFNSFVRLQQVDPGFEAENVYVVPLRLGDRLSDEGDRGAVIRRLVEGVEGIPQVEAAAASPVMPFDRGRCCWRTWIRTLGMDEADSTISWLHPVTPAFFETLGLAQLSGRGLGWQDGAGIDVWTAEETGETAQVPVWVSRHVADRFWPGASALDRVIRDRRVEYIVAGVVDDARHFGLGRDIEPNIYVPYVASASVFDETSLALRIRSDAGALATDIQRAVWSLDPSIPVEPPVPMTQRIGESVTEPRFYSLLLVSFATVAFLLAAGGIYSSMLYTVGQRHREMGIRMALGATGSHVMLMVAKRGAMLTAVGIAVGLGGAFALSRLLENLVFGITTTDPATFGFVSILLGVVAMTACYLPARRASRADPMVTLRAE